MTDREKDKGKDRHRERERGGGEGEGEVGRVGGSLFSINVALTTDTRFVLGTSVRCSCDEG